MNRDEIEKNVLTSMVHDARARLFALNEICKEQFSTAQGRALYQIIATMEAQRKEINDTALIHDDRTTALMIWLSDCHPASTRFRNDIEALRRLSEMDRVRNIYLQMQETVQKMTINNIDDTKDKAVELIMGIGRKKRNQPVKVSDAIAEYIRTFDQKENHELIGSICELKELYDITGDFKAGMIITLSGGTGVGKSIIGQNLVHYTGAKSCIMSYEMTVRECTNRYIAMITGIEAYKIDKKWTSTEENEKLVRLSNSVKTHEHILIQEEPERNISKLVNDINYLAGSGYKMYMIDTLSFVTAGDRNRNNDLEIVMHELKNTAIKCGVCILVIVQLNRSKKEDEPQLWHIRDSGAIEQDSNLVIMLDRVMQNDTEMENIVKFYVRKNRSGRQGECTLYIDKSRMQLLSQSEKQVGIEF